MPENKIDGSRILVTGGAGHIGSHVVDELLDHYDPEKVIIFDNFSSGRMSNIPPGDPRIEVIGGDIRDCADIYSVLSCCDYVFHLASILLLECRDKPEKAINVNITGTHNLIKAASELGIKKFIFSSSGSVYGDPIRLPMDEEHPHNSETLYGTTKITGEHLLRDYYKLNGLQYVGLRYFNVYGPRQHYKGAYAQIIPNWVDSILADKPLIIRGDGTQTMDMTYVTDVARANILALESDIISDFINIGTGKSWAINDIANIMMEIVGKTLPIEYVPQDINLVKRRQCSIEKAEKLIGFKYDVDIYEGIKRYYEWRKCVQD